MYKRMWPRNARPWNPALEEKSEHVKDVEMEVDGGVVL
jgi:pre-rRNA-processing protein TSR1